MLTGKVVIHARQRKSKIFVQTHVPKPQLRQEELQMENGAATMGIALAETVVVDFLVS